MLPSQMNFQELFSNPGACLNNVNCNEPCESQALSQFSTQMDFPDSQEHNSQNSLINSPGRKFYGCYTGVLGYNRYGAMDHSRSQHQLTTAKPVSHDLQDHIVRAKDRDERDILKVILGEVRESAHGFMSSVTAIKKTIEDDARGFDKKLECYFQKIHDAIVSCNRGVMEASSVNNYLKDEIKGKNDQLSSKETQISLLEEQLEVARSDRCNDLVMQLANLSETHYSKTCEEMKTLYDCHEKKVHNIMEEYENHLSRLNSDQANLEVIANNQESVKSQNKRLEQQLQSVMEQLELSNENLLRDMKGEFSNIEKKLNQNLPKLIEAQISAESEQCEKKQNQAIGLLSSLNPSFTSKLTEKFENCIELEFHKFMDIMQTFMLEAKNDIEEKLHNTMTCLKLRVEGDMLKLDEFHKKQLDYLWSERTALSQQNKFNAAPMLLRPEQVNQDVLQSMTDNGHFNSSSEAQHLDKIPAIYRTDSVESTNPPSSNFCVYPGNTGQSLNYISPSIKTRSSFEQSMYSHDYFSAIQSSPVPEIFPQLNLEVVKSADAAVMFDGVCIQNTSPNNQNLKKPNKTRKANKRRKKANKTRKKASNVNTSRNENYKRQPDSLLERQYVVCENQDTQDTSGNISPVGDSMFELAPSSWLEENKSRYTECEQHERSYKYSYRTSELGQTSTNALSNKGGIEPQIQSFTAYAFSTKRLQSQQDIYDFRDEVSPVVCRKQPTGTKLPWNDCKSYGKMSYTSKTLEKYAKDKTKTSTDEEIPYHMMLREQKHPLQHLNMLLLGNEDSPKKSHQVCSSEASSPSMSVTEVIIKRKFRHRVKKVKK